MKHKILGLALLALPLVACNDFLTREPYDKLRGDNDETWNSEDVIKYSMYNVYPTFFKGYNSSWGRADWFAETNIADWNDDNAQEVATFFTKNVPTATTAATQWNFDQIHTVNTYLDKLSRSTILDEPKRHWTGVNRFLRAVEYAKLVSNFGDVPYYQQPIAPTDKATLYRAFSPRLEVMDSVLSDMKYAMENVRLTDGEKGLNITRDLVYAYASRIFLFEGTWQKYHNPQNTEVAAKYLQVAKDAADYVLKSKRYELCSNYKDLTTSIDLAGNPEIILYRAYAAGVVTHSLMTFNNTEPEKSSPSRSLIESYLMQNGLPITQEGGNAMYQGDKDFKKEMMKRDPRLYATIDTTELRLPSVAAVYATSGYFANRFVNPTLINAAGGKSYTNITDAPVMKLNEVMLNYIEAAAELATLGKYTLTQADFDLTINALRKRPSTNMPALQLVGDALHVPAGEIKDSQRQANVSPILWEIRRERRVELVYEGLRFNDLRRWKKLEDADMQKNPKLNMGAFVNKKEYVAWYNQTHPAEKPENVLTLEKLSKMHLIQLNPATGKDEVNDTVGYIIPIVKEDFMRTFANKDYLYPIPIDQLTLYRNAGHAIKQNPGWEK